MTNQHQRGEMGRTIFDRHTCDAMVVHCIDFRFWRNLHDFMETTLSIHDFDSVSLAGGAKNLSTPSDRGMLETVLTNIGISERLHHIKKLVLANHIDCGAYGGSSKFKDKEEEVAFHAAELDKAEKIAKEKYPNLEVIKILVSRKGDGIDFLVL